MEDRDVWSTNSFLSKHSLRLEDTVDAYGLTCKNTMRLQDSSFVEAYVGARRWMCINSFVDINTLKPEDSLDLYKLFRQSVR